MKSNRKLETSLIRPVWSTTNVKELEMYWIESVTFLFGVIARRPTDASISSNHRYLV
jgi:hypothetical protein